MICVLSGGGLDCVALLGSFEYLDLKPSHFIGCSGGAIISVLLICGYTWQEIRDILIDDTYIDTLINSTQINLNEMLINFGVYNTTTFYEKFSNLIEKKTKKNVTLSEFTKIFGTDLTIVGSNISTKKCVYFNHVSHPNMSIVLCLQISCNIPFIFQAVKYNDELYVDGAVFDMFPYEFALKTYPNQETVGIRVNGFYPAVPISNIYDFIKNLSFSILEKLLNGNETGNVYTIDCSNMGLDFVAYIKLTKEKRGLFVDNLYNEGRVQTTKTHLSRSIVKKDNESS
jgi:predicted acylesterase/phospholipase RssA